MPKTGEIGIIRNVSKLIWICILLSQNGASPRRILSDRRRPISSSCRRLVGWKKLTNNYGEDRLRTPAPWFLLALRQYLKRVMEYSMNLCWELRTWLNVGGAAITTSRHHIPWPQICASSNIVSRDCLRGGSWRDIGCLHTYVSIGGAAMWRHQRRRVSHQR